MDMTCIDCDNAGTCIGTGKCVKEVSKLETIRHKFMQTNCNLCDMVSECSFARESNGTMYCGNSTDGGGETVVDFSSEIMEEMMSFRT